METPLGKKSKIRSTQVNFNEILKLVDDKFRVYSKVELKILLSENWFLKLAILASRRYTRSNPDLNPPTIVSDPQNIEKKAKFVVETSTLAKN